MEKGVTVRSFGNEVEAQLAQATLERHGIPSRVQRFSRYRAMAGRGYLLVTPYECIEQAKEVLEAIDREIDMDEYVDENDSSYRRCPECGSVNLEVAPLTWGQWFAALGTAGIALLRIARDRRCKKCGHAWQA